MKNKIFTEKQVVRIARYERNQKTLHKAYRMRKVKEKLQLKALMQALFKKFQKNAQANIKRRETPPETPIGS